MSAQERILIIDDERSVVRALELVLRREGYGVLTAFAGPEGLHKAWEEKPDLILLDIVMPDMDGLSVPKYVGELVELMKRGFVTIL